MAQAEPSLTVSMAANLGGFENGRLQCRQFLQQQQVEPHTIDVFELVLEECVTNTLQYGYGDTGLHWIDVELSLHPSHLHLTIEDDAGPFDPLLQPEPVLPQTLDEARIGGLGLLMVRRSTSRLEYTRAAGRNRLVARIDRRH